MDIEDVVRAGPLEVSPSVACAAWLHGEPLRLTAHQVRVLAALVAARGKLLMRDELFERSRGRPSRDRSRAIDSDVWRIRRALGPAGAHLRAVRKVGYALDVDALARLSRNAAVTPSFHERDRSVTGS